MLSQHKPVNRVILGIALHKSNILALQGSMQCQEENTAAFFSLFADSQQVWVQKLPEKGISFPAQFFRRMTRILSSIVPNKSKGGISSLIHSDSPMGEIRFILWHSMFPSEGERGVGPATLVGGEMLSRP